MNLLPKSSSEFNSKEYWNQFFKKRGKKSFEWYGEYAELCGHLHKYMRPTDKIIVSGCGNSNISGDLYKVGYYNIVNIDISEIVIKQMKEKYSSTCPDMKWIHGDVCKMDVDSEGFSCVLDKGTLDAMMSEDNSLTREDAFNYFDEINRILKIGGRYILISLLQEHILSAILSWFPDNGWMMRCSRCEEAEFEGEDGSFSFPVFVIVCTKFKKMNNFAPIIELNLKEGSISRLNSIEELKKAIVSIQQFSLLSHNLKNKSVAGSELKFDLCDPKTGFVRYSLHVVDSGRNRHRGYFAAFIVPLGREMEYIFSNPKGQLQLLDQCQVNRLIVVHLKRGQMYGKLEDVQNELAGRILELTPRKMPEGVKIPFLTSGGDLGLGKECFRGSSIFSGDFIVEDLPIPEEGYTLRRLVFLSNQNVVQSEVKLAKGFGNSDSLGIDPSYLSCEHHILMVASLAFISKRDPMVLLIGLGGGTLATYIHKYFSKVKLMAVDIDEAIVNVAKNWFGFSTSARLGVKVEDGLKFIRNAVVGGLKYDLIMFDIDSKEISEGLSCPPKEFIEKSFLDVVSNLLSQNGIFVLNCICRDKKLKQEIISNIRLTFPVVISIQNEEILNDVLFCKFEKVKNGVDHLEDQLSKLNKQLKERQNSKKDIFDLGDVMKNLTIL